MSVSDFAEALDTFKEQVGKLPFAVYVDPITLVNTDFTDIEVFGIPVKVSTCCSIGNFYLVNEEQADEIEAWEAGQREARAKEEAWN